jgi:imidazolonepropionase-like amidohydrolase
MQLTNRFVATTAALASLGLVVQGQDAKKSEPAKPSKKQVTAFIGGDVYTVTRGVIRGGTVLVVDGKITQVGQNVTVPEGAALVDVSGKVIAPGFVAVSATGVAVRGAGGPGGGQGRGGGRQQDQGRITDSLNPYDRNIQMCLAAGITTACVETGGGGGGRFGRDSDEEFWLDPAVQDGTRVCPCCGQAIIPTEPITPPAPTERTARRSAVLKMTFGDVSGMVVKESPFYHLPAGSFSGALNRHQWRETIKRARQQIKDQAAAGDDNGFDPTFGGGFGGGAARQQVPDEVLKLVEKKIPLRTEAYSAEQMREAIALAKELDYNLILDGVHEAWLMPGELSSAKVQVVLTPRSRRRAQPGKEDSSGSSIETSAYLEKAGVPFAVTPVGGTSVSLDGIPGRDLTSLPLEAAFAVRGGCSEQTALEALTINAARIVGLGDRIGSIEAGKDADLLILDGVPLDYRTYVKQAYVNGRLSYDREREKIFPVRK